jgi:hypothetical protein
MVSLKVELGFLSSAGGSSNFKVAARTGGSQSKSSGNPGLLKLAVPMADLTEKTSHSSTFLGVVR